jgi:hypothetical protein
LVGGDNAQGGSSGNSVAGRNFCLSVDSVQVESFPTTDEVSRFNGRLPCRVDESLRSRLSILAMRSPVYSWRL